MEDLNAEPYSGFLFIINTLLRPFSFEIIIGIAIVTLLLFFSAMVSGSEIAFFSINPQQIKDLLNSKSKKSNTVVYLLEKPKRLLATILITNNFINVGIVILSTYLTYRIFNFENYPVVAFVIEILVVSFFLLLFGEIIPKVYATQFPTKFAKRMSLPLFFLKKFFRPLSSILIYSTSMIDKRITKKGHNISIHELSDALELTADSGQPEEEQKILKGIVKFGDKDVKEIMRSRIDVTAVEYNTHFDELIDKIQKSGFSRIPVYRENFDNVAGILYIKDLLQHLKQDRDYPWQSLLRPPFFVPESKMINDLLKEFQEKKIHMAVVVDEYGGTAGIVTLEDVIEEIVGEINDEFDAEENNYTQVDDNNYIFEGKTLLNDFCRVIGVDNELFESAKGESDTLAGLILELKGEIPGKNEVIHYRNFEFKILTVDNRRIKKIKVTIK